MSEDQRDDRVREYVRRLDQARATLGQELHDQVERVRHLTITERGRWVADACASAWAILRARDDFEQAVVAEEQRAPDFDEKWRSLRQRQRIREGVPV